MKHQKKKKKKKKKNLQLHLMPTLGLLGVLDDGGHGHGTLLWMRTRGQRFTITIYVVQLQGSSSYKLLTKWKIV